ncbi:MAG: hypothetical protein GWP08_02495 [Nitrospiraceae bacterium]|nr:hypothetical protein [Nitrospiraceae bacterium]
MSTDTQQPSRWRTLWGWIRWSPVILIPFSALFFDTWLSTQRIKRDYVINELKTQIRRARADLDDLAVEAARLGNMERIEVEAPEMGLQPPEPDQIRLVYYTQPEPEEPAHSLATLSGSGAYATGEE